MLESVSSSTNDTSSSNTRKYLLYAIGEILLMMIGILLALQVNNWNQNRLDRNKEKLLLKEIKAEFEYNKEGLQSTFEYYTSVVKNILF